MEMGIRARIHKEMPFPPFDVLVGIVATDPRRLLDRFYALGIYAGCTWVRMPSLSFAFSPMQRPQQKRPGPFEAQTPEMVEDGLPRWKVRWKVAPRTAGAQHVEDRIEHGSQGVNWRSTTSGQGREMALQILPLRIRKVTGITGTHPASLSHW
jgi:hypothetical protein